MMVKVKIKEVDLYSGFIVLHHTQGAQVRITQCYLQITPYLPLPHKHSPDGAFPDWGCGYLIAAYYSFIYPEKMKGWVGLVGWPTADGLPTLVVTRQPQVERRTAKVRLSETDVLPCACHATNMITMMLMVIMTMKLCVCVKTWTSAECTTADVLSCVTIRKVHLAADVTTASSSNLIDETASVSIRQTSVC